MTPDLSGEQYWRLQAEEARRERDEAREEARRMRAENLAISRKDVVWYNVAEDLRAKIEAALAAIKVGRSDKSIAAILEGREALTGGREK